MKTKGRSLIFENNAFFYWMSYPVFLFLAVIYGCIVRFLRWAYEHRVLRTYRSKVPVISVGNVCLGGTGKTPLVEMITQYLLEQQAKPAIVIRGYKRPESREERVDAANEYFTLGDEASMLHDSLHSVPIHVGRNRISSVKKIEKTKCDIVVLDDGFQHWRLRRDTDIVVIDVSQGVFNQKLLPLGYLREPIASLRKAHMFVLSKVDLAAEGDVAALHQRLRTINPSALISTSEYKPHYFVDIFTNQQLPIDVFEKDNRPVVIMTGIANPLYFDKMCSLSHLNVKREFVFPDHHHYRLSDIRRIRDVAKKLNIATLVTTHKDAMRLKHFQEELSGFTIVYLKIKLSFVSGRDKFFNKIQNVYHRTNHLITR